MNDEVSHCYERAAICREMGARQADPFNRHDYLDLERSWLLLAESYEVAHRTAEAIQELERGAQRKRTAARSASWRAQWITELLRRAHEPIPTDVARPVSDNA